MNNNMATNQMTSSSPSLGIMRNISWKMIFFFAAVCTLISGVYCWAYLLFSCQWIPILFLTHTFFLIFGVLMFMLDFPFQTANPHLMSVRANIYKFLLFMTRFTGRGIWYTFLSTMIFTSLWGLNISGFFGVLLCVPVMGIGIVCTYIGWSLSKKLNNVKLSQTDDACPRSGLSFREFEDICQNAGVVFTKTELEYVFNALSNTQDSGGMIRQSDFQAWVKGGSLMLLV